MGVVAKPPAAAVQATALKPCGLRAGMLRVDWAVLRALRAICEGWRGVWQRGRVGERFSEMRSPRSGLFQTGWVRRRVGHETPGAESLAGILMLLGQPGTGLWGRSHRTAADRSEGFYGFLCANSEVNLGGSVGCMGD
jgi:hypothetical protein